MDPTRLLSLNFLLFLSLGFELSCGTGEGMNCPKVLGQLGSSVLLPLTSEGLSKIMNKSIHVLVTRAESPGNSVKKKIVSIYLPEGGSPPYLEDGYKFHLEKPSLEIVESKRKDEAWYFITLEENVSVQSLCVQLKLYEQVSTPEIKVLNWTQQNGNCSLTLACVAEKGDHVAYSWSEEADSHPLSPADGSHLLALTLGPQHANSVYVCTASNPVSNRSQTFVPQSRCRLDPSGKANQYRPTVEAKNLTIYAQVQKSGSVQKKADPLPAPDPCTTIYVAATEPVPEPVLEPHSFTVYASVTLPDS
ncbi:signaling lymphocytic activation molecule isoform X2 [Manis pentadactyla]|uniref:signaling lymphocytic activation molecule isoform X2 n=1 Tax=Manis pentadactyla TaxID=143292 RepID=UPI001876EF9A|nr:signaling lymphocytic activation molecule isoform X2 [Manis pentadactyla]